MPIPKDAPAVSHELLLDLDREPGPLHGRLVAALRTAVRTGRVNDGDRLPPSRTLAGQLGVSRWVVVEAYTQLTAEGYLESRPGSGTVVRALPTGRATEPRPVPAPAAAPRFDLAPGVPDLRAFPRSRWLEAYRLAVAERGDAELEQPPGSTWIPAADAVSGYLQRARGLARPGTVVELTRGSAAAARILARSLIRHGHRVVAAEDPSWPGLRDAFGDAGIAVLPIDVDHQGLRVDQLRSTPQVRVVLVTPAHQFPTGALLSAGRRRELLAWAAAVDGLVIEDDYDAEFRYDHRPVATLQGLAPDRVVLLGSVSKTLAPSLGLGWMAVPDRWQQELTLPGQAPPLFEQSALGTLVGRGWYERHLVKARQRYRRRRTLLLDALGAALPGQAPSGIAAGLHLVLPLPDGTDERAVVAAAADLDLRLVPMRRYRIRPSSSSRPSLVIGYGNLRDGAEAEAAHRLARAIAAVR